MEERFSFKANSRCPPSAKTPLKVHLPYCECPPFLRQLLFSSLGSSSLYSFYTGAPRAPLITGLWLQPASWSKAQMPPQVLAWDPRGLFNWFWRLQGTWKSLKQLEKIQTGIPDSIPPLTQLCIVIFILVKWPTILPVAQVTDFRAFLHASFSHNQDDQVIHYGQWNCPNNK